MSELNLLYTDVEDDLRASVHALLSDQCDPVAVTRIYDGDRSIVPPLRRALGHDLGLAGLLVAEERGGAGASAREAAVVLEEFGRFAAPVPFLTSAVIGAIALEGSAGDLLDRFAEGSTTLALVLPFTQTSWGAIPIVEPGHTVRSVAGALEADVLLVPVQVDGRIALAAVASDEAQIVPVSSLDMTRQLADITVRSTGEIVVPDAEAALRKALLFGAGLLASEQLGVARWCLEETVSYLKVRRQFGRVVGGFMALKHRLADLYTEVESAAAAARYAAATLGDGDGDGDADAEVAVALAQAYCSQVAVHAAEEAVQLHGGIGMTWEHPAHLYLKKAKADQIGLGTPGAHRAHLATLINIEE